MSYREPIDHATSKEIYEAAVECFKEKEITEDQFRKILRHLGMNAVEIDREVELHQPSFTTKCPKFGAEQWTCTKTECICHLKEKINEKI